MKNRKLAARIVCWILAGLMILSVVAVAFWGIY